MVDTVRNSPNAGTSTVHDQRKSRVSQVDQSQSSLAEKATATGSGQSVSVDLSVSEKVKSLSSEPPVNIEVVTEIRQKVSEGRYPIDLNAITNKLFESIKEGEG
jgi:negative regulator of flagellin synthesis FlgM